MAATRTVNTSIGPLVVHETGAGAPLVFWHRLFVDHRMFSRQMAAFSEHRRCIAIDGPGHGASAGPPSGATLDDCAMAAVEILDALNVDRPDFVGCGWGGHIGVCVASSHPTRLRSLAVATAPMQRGTSAERRRVAVLSYLYRALGPRRFLSEAAVNAVLSEEHRAEHGAYVRECFAMSPRKGLYEAMQSFVVKRPSVEDRLTNIKVPTLFLCSPGDTWWPLSMAQRHAETVKARLEIVPHTGQLSPLEAPDAVNRLLQDFWANTGRREVAR